MNIDFQFWENVLFNYVYKIKRFNNGLKTKYNLNDIPYNLAGIKFPRVGNISIDDDMVFPYRFHGQGATFFENELEVSYIVDASSKHQIVTSSSHLCVFLDGFLKSAFDKTILEEVMIKLEEKGLFVKRKPSDFKAFHINESWYWCVENRLPFKGQDMTDADWL